MRKSMLILPSAALLLGLSACTTADSPAPSGAPAPPRATPSISAPNPAITPSPSATSAPSASTSSTAASRACKGADLRGALSRNDGAAGRNYFDVALTNAGDEACRLQGYPKVLAVDKAGKNTQDLSQIGEDAGHTYWDYRAQAGEDGPKDNPVVNLAPGAKAYFQLSYPSIYDYATGEVRDDPYQQMYNAECGSATPVKGFFVITPGEVKIPSPTPGVFVDDPTGPIPVCDSFKGPYVQVSEFVSQPTTG